MKLEEYIVDFSSVHAGRYHVVVAMLSLSLLADYHGRLLCVIGCHRNCLCSPMLTFNAVIHVLVKIRSFGTEFYLQLFDTSNAVLFQNFLPKECVGSA